MRRRSFLVGLAAGLLLGAGCTVFIGWQYHLADMKTSIASNLSTVVRYKNILSNSGVAVLHKNLDADLLYLYCLAQEMDSHSSIYDDQAVVEVRGRVEHRLQQLGAKPGC